MTDDQSGRTPDALDDLIGSIRRPRPSAEPTIGATSGDALDDLLALRKPASDASDAPSVGASRRTWQIGLALTLGLVAFAGVMADAIASATLLSDSGPWALAVVWPLGGAGLLAMAYAQARFIDRFARVTVLSWMLGAYAAAFAVLGLVFALDVAGAWAPAAAWLLADQMNFLLPLVVWALAGDVFTAGQGVAVFPRLSRAIFLGQIIGLGVAVVVPATLHPSNAALGMWLFAPMAACIVAVVAFPALLRGATTGVGHGRQESAAESVRVTVSYIRELSAFNWLWKASFAVMAAGFVLEFLYFDITSQHYDSASDLQTMYAGATVVGFLLCAGIQTWVTPHLLRRQGVARALTVLPITVVIAALVMVGAGTANSLPVAVGALLLWRLPRWSLDGSARQSAQATIPDERRARTSFLIDLVPIGTALVVVVIPISITLTTQQRWIAPIIAVVLGLVASRFASRTLATWDDTQLSYRLKRRKRLA